MEHERDSMLMTKQRKSFHHLLDLNKKKEGGFISLFLGFVSSTMKPCFCSF